MTEIAGTGQQRKPTPPRKPRNKVDSVLVATWIGTAAVIAIGVTGFAFWCGTLSSDIGHLKDDVRAINLKLDQIESQLFNLRAKDAPAEVLQKLAAANPEVFRESLPALRVAASELRPSGVQPPPATLRTIATKLIDVPVTAPGYWPTVAQFPSLASRQSASYVHPQGIPVKFGGMTITDMKFSDRTVIFAYVNLRNVTFERCLIFFDDLGTVTMQSVTFEDCVINIPEMQNPVPRFRETVRQMLLASDIKWATLNVD